MQVEDISFKEVVKALKDFADDSIVNNKNANLIDNNAIENIKNNFASKRLLTNVMQKPKSLFLPIRMCLTAVQQSLSRKKRSQEKSLRHCLKLTISKYAQNKNQFLCKFVHTYMGPVAILTL